MALPSLCCLLGHGDGIDLFGRAVFDRDLDGICAIGPGGRAAVGDGRFAVEDSNGGVLVLGRSGDGIGRIGGGGCRLRHVRAKRGHQGQRVDRQPRKARAHYAEVMVPFTTPSAYSTRYWIPDITMLAIWARAVFW